MLDTLRSLIGNHVNFVFCRRGRKREERGRDQFAKWLVDLGDKPVHFFDMDMTKRCSVPVM